VADLDRSIDYYGNAIGLSVNERANGGARLGVPGRDLVVLEEQPGARPGRGTNTGLFHLALLVPERRDLAAWLAHAAETGVRLSGASDHFVSEALYLRDPDNNGVELYWDKPKEQWPRTPDGKLAMVTQRLDLKNLLGELEHQPA
jgi:catechol 2,3-dioxygenase